MNGSTRRTVRGVGSDQGPPGCIGDRLRKAGKLTDHDIIRIVNAQTRGKMRFGEAAVELNLLTAEEIQMVLSQQFKYPYFQSGDVTWSQDLFLANDPFGAQSEAVRSLRSDLVLRGFGDAKKIIAVTGGRAGDGTSTLAANLAISFAQLGERTLLIDADMRKPRQQSLFGLADGAGLSNLLNGRCTMNDVLSQMRPFDNLTVLSAGAIPPNPQELLSQVGFSYLIETAPAAFDLVIIDTPPILEFADAQVVSRRAGACLCVARRNKTTLADVAQVKMQIERSGAQAAGAVVWD
jgi:protein-tyrosine kinase